MYYSQYGEDEWLEKNYPKLNVGTRFAIDVGAADGIEFSNTKYFENKGWRGLLIEPNIKMKHLLRQNRVWPALCPIAIDKGNASSVGFKEDGLFSRIDPGEVEVRCLTLDYVVRAFKLEHLDLLSVDTEGNDLRVWESLTRLRPQVIIIEHLAAGVGSLRGEIMRRAKIFQYDIVHETTCNFILINKIKSNFLTNEI